MPTLHKTTEETKLILKWLAGIVLAFFLLLFGLRAANNIKEFFFPTPPPPPTVSFQKLPKIQFPQKDSQNLTYSLNTLSGTFPPFPDRVTVYKLVTFQPDLLSLRKAQKKVNSVGFTDSGTQLSENTYKWLNKNSVPQQTLTLNIFTYDFNLRSDYIMNNSLFNPGSTPDENSVKDTALSFLSKIVEIPEDIDSSKTKVTLLSYENGNLSNATSVSKAKAARVSLFQKDIEKLPFVYPNPPDSTMNFLVVNGQLVDGNYFHRSATEISATYPIKTASEAFSELQKGQGYVAEFDGSGTKISVNNATLAYYSSETQVNYLLPVYVFEGDHNFKGYVPAVSNYWVE